MDAKVSPDLGTDLPPRQAQLQNQGQQNQGQQSSTVSLTPLGFGSIPPERVGLYGEYDHDGLAKRVRLKFQSSFTAEEIRNLRVCQRGTVIVLLGEVQSLYLRDRIVQLALSTAGARYVEFNGVSVAPFAGLLAYS